MRTGRSCSRPAGSRAASPPCPARACVRPARPVNTLEDRLAVLAALRCVDHLVPFDEDTPCELVRLVRPDVFVKGGDYTIDRLPEAKIVAELGGVVRILPLVEERSTTGLI